MLHKLGATSISILSRHFRKLAVRALSVVVGAARTWCGRFTRAVTDGHAALVRGAHEAVTGAAALAHHLLCSATGRNTAERHMILERAVFAKLHVA